MSGGPLLERERELAILEGFLRALGSSGTGGAALIEGPPGIGKSALLEAALGVVPEGVEILRARGSELEAGLAFGGVRQLLAPLVLRLGPDEREELLTGPAGLARAVLGLDSATPESADALADPLYGVYWLTADLADRSPLLLALDDLHWLDEESGRFIAYLARRLEGLPVLVLATARPDEPGALNEPTSAVPKNGPRYLRWALVEAATTACRHPVYAERYQRNKQRLGRQRGAKVAQIDIARRLCEAIWHMLTKSQPFSPAGATLP